MTLTISMPQLGLTMTEATVSVWLKKPGDSVKKDEAVLSVSTDKVDMDIEATADGVLREIMVEEGKTVPVGTPLAYLDTGAGTGPQESAIPAPPAKSPPPPVASTVTITNTDPALIRALEEEEPGETLRSSPRARRQARQLGIDLTKVQGSGPQGRIVEKDLLQLAPSRPAPVPVPVQNDSKRRRVIAESMLQSIRTIPPFSVSLEVNAEKLVSLYQSLKEVISRRAGHKLTYTDLLFRALALSLADTPAMNAVWEAEEVRPRSQIVLGLAVATDRGVVAPVLSGVESIPLVKLVTGRAELAEKARQSRLTFADLEGGVGTLSNLGMYRIDRFEGIISPGQSFILAAGKLRNRPWVEDTSLLVRPTIILNLSVDHRVADGATAAVFLERIAEIIENPYRILWNE